MALFKLNDESLLASLDVGSCGIRCAVFRKSAKLPLDMLAFAEEKSSGLEESRIVNFESLSLALRSVLESAEERCKSSFSEVWLGFSPPFQSFRSQGMAVLADREVSPADLDLAVQTARAVPLPDRHICLHSAPDSFRVDSQAEVLNPLGLSGLRLETEVYLVAVPRFYCRDMAKALKLLGYKPKAFFHNLAAFGQNLTSAREKRDGVCFCDIGYAGSRAVVYFKGKAEEMFSIDMGGRHFSLALAGQFNISLEEAEALKEEKGCLLFSSRGAEESIETSGGSLYLSRKLFCQTLEKSAEGLLERLKAELKRRGLLEKASGFVFTGGTAYLPGFIELAGFYLGGRASHPENLYESFKQTNNLALIQQAYLENKLESKKRHFSERRSIWRDLF